MYDALCVKLAALPDDTLVYCGHEYTEGNLKFALTIEPENVELKERYDRVVAIRANAAADWHDATPAEMTIPSTLADEKATNPFMRSDSAEELGRIRELKDNF
jgi:hydroxyacylglutathione hydrolase